jgi:hypothetical protein
MGRTQILITNVTCFILVPKYIQQKKVMLAVKMMVYLCSKFLSEFKAYR